MSMAWAIECKDILLRISVIRDFGDGPVASTFQDTRSMSDSAGSCRRTALLGDGRWLHLFVHV